MGLRIKKGQGMKIRFSLRTLVVMVFLAAGLLYGLLQRLRETTSTDVLFLPSGDVVKLETSTLWGFLVDQRLVDAEGERYGLPAEYVAFLPQGSPELGEAGLNWGKHGCYSEWSPPFS